jgi:hypothetical protein
MNAIQALPNASKTFKVTKNDDELIVTDESDQKILSCFVDQQGIDCYNNDGKIVYRIVQPSLFRHSGAVRVQPPQPADKPQPAPSPPSLSSPSDPLGTRSGGGKSRRSRLSTNVIAALVSAASLAEQKKRPGQATTRPKPAKSASGRAAGAK